MIAACLYLRTECIETFEFIYHYTDPRGLDAIRAIVVATRLRRERDGEMGLKAVASLLSIQSRPPAAATLSNEREYRTIQTMSLLKLGAA